MHSSIKLKAILPSNTFLLILANDHNWHVSKLQIKHYLSILIVSTRDMFYNDTISERTKDIKELIALILLLLMSFFISFAKNIATKITILFKQKGVLECGYCGWGPWWKKSSSSAGINDIEDFQIAAKTPRLELDTPFSNGWFLKDTETNSRIILKGSRKIFLYFRAITMV